jgi:hypothetical protein
MPVPKATSVTSGTSSAKWLRTCSSVYGSNLLYSNPVNWLLDMYHMIGISIINGHSQWSNQIHVGPIIMINL